MPFQEKTKMSNWPWRTKYAKPIMKNLIPKFEDFVNENLKEAYGPDEKKLKAVLINTIKQYESPDVAISDIVRILKSIKPEAGKIILQAAQSTAESISEAGDHEVGMAQNLLDDIIDNAQKLKMKIGKSEKDLAGWIQDHISQAQNYINQANTGFHELSESASVDTAFALKEIKKYNKGQFPYNEDKNLNQLASEIIKHLGFKVSDDIIEKVEDHLVASTEDDEVPADTHLIDEIRDLLN